LKAAIFSFVHLAVEMDPKKIPRVITLPAVLIDVAFGGYFIALLKLQSEYVPGSCTGAATWEYDSVGQATWFTIIGEGMPKSPPPHKACRQFIIRKVVEILYV
jgi:hypothetical protein